MWATPDCRVTPSTSDGWIRACECRWLHRLEELRCRLHTLPSQQALPGKSILKDFEVFSPHVDVEAFRPCCWMRDAEGCAPPPRRRLHRGSFAPSSSIEKKGEWCCEWLFDFRHKHHILHDYPCFYDLQESDNWTTSAMNVPGYFGYGTDHSRTAILCPRQAAQCLR